MSETDPITNDQDVIDSRDVIARIEYLRGLQAEGDETLDPNEETELIALEALASEGESFSDWPYGETLIRDSYFTEYARELATDIGAVIDDASWPYTCIDWGEAAFALQSDYTSLDFDGVTYWARG